MKILEFLQDICLIAAYFFMADHLAPELVRRGYRWVWWLIIVAWVSCAYVLSLLTLRKHRSTALLGVGTVTIAYTLLVITAFLYDENAMRPYLRAHGIRWAWVPALVLTFLWVVASVRRRHWKRSNLNI